MSITSTFAIELPPDLLAGVRRGDLRAFEQLFRLFERPVFNLALRMLGDRDEAMETMHDIFLKVSAALPGFRGESPFWGWLRQITVNETLMRLRRRASRPAHEDIEEIEQEAPGGATPQSFAEAAELERAIAELPAMTRCVLWLYHAEGYTHEEIGVLTGHSTSFSKSQLARGTQRLRRDLLERSTTAELPTPVFARQIRYVH